tara:strand:+ start:2589 stop:2972 length:384 start_codon:yes stop_codon:yes gene_type:complete
MQVFIGEHIYCIGFKRSTFMSKNKKKGKELTQIECFVKYLHQSDTVDEAIEKAGQGDDGLPVVATVRQNFHDKPNNVLARKLALTKALRDFPREHRKLIWHAYKHCYRLVPGKKVVETTEVEEVQTA